MLMRLGEPVGPANVYRTNQHLTTDVTNVETSLWVKPKNRLDLYLIVYPSLKRMAVETQILRCQDLTHEPDSWQVVESHPRLSGWH